MATRVGHLMPVFDYQFEVAASVDDVSAFHFQPRILQTLTPPLTILRIHRFEPLRDGAIAEFTMWLGPVPVFWRAVHSQVSPQGFTDTQTDGPMKRWVHTHRFVALDSSRSRVIEHIEYEHHTGWRGIRSRLLFNQVALRFLFHCRRRITRRSVQPKSSARI